jgi:integrase
MFSVTVDTMWTPFFDPANMPPNRLGSRSTPFFHPNLSSGSGLDGIMERETSVRLTKRIVEAAVPRAERYHLWDVELAGFALRVEKSGTKTFVVRYRADGGGRSAPRRFMTIGRYGTLTVEEARRQAKTMLGAVAKGEDPAGERSAKRRGMTIAALIDLYGSEGCIVQRGIRQGTPMKALTKAYTLARLRNHVVPLLGHKRVSELDAGAVERFVRDVAAGKTAKDEKVGTRKRVIVRGGDGAARKVVRDLSAMCSFAVRRRIIASNPCATAAVRKTDNRRERYLTLAEIMRLGEALRELEQEGANPKAINIARLWALTGCRRDEITGLKWSEIDVDRALLVLADSKTGKSVRPLGLAARTLLAAIDPEPDSEFVFPATRGKGHYQGTETVWSEAVRRANLPGVTPHTLRHTMGSTAVSTGEALAMTGAILGHSNSRSTSIYAHVQDDPARRAADRVSKRIAAALNGQITVKATGRGSAKQASNSNLRGRNVAEPSR